MVTHRMLDWHDVVVGERRLAGLLRVPAQAQGLIIFAHGSGSGRFSPRNNFVAEALDAAGFATLLFDLLTETECEDRRNVFDIALLAERVRHAIDLASTDPRIAMLRIGLFGASTGAAAALVGAAWCPNEVAAVVSRGGRPDLAGDALEQVGAATLLIVGSADEVVLALNEQAARRLRCERSLAVVPGATHLFEEPGALEQVVELAREWFLRHLAGAPDARRSAGSRS